MLIILSKGVCECFSVFLSWPKKTRKVFATISIVKEKTLAKEHFLWQYCVYIYICKTSLSIT